MSGPPGPDHEPPIAFERIAQLALVGFGAYLGYRMFQPVFPAILWGFLLAVVLAHPYERLSGRIGGRRGWADAVFALALTLMLVLPALLFVWELVRWLPPFVERAKALSASGLPPLPAGVIETPFIGPWAAGMWNDIAEDSSAVVRDIAGHAGGVASWLVGKIGSFSSFVLEFLLGAVVAIYVLHRRFEVRAFIARLLDRIGGDYAHQLVLGAFETTRNAFAGIIAAAIAQTALASAALFAANVPALTLMAGLTFLLAIVQIGPVVVLLIADAILILRGDMFAAALVTAWFVGVVMAADNVIRPYFASKGTDLPWGLSFLGAIGGFVAWGLIGAFVAPVLTAVLYEIVMNWVYPARRNTPPETF